MTPQPSTLDLASPGTVTVGTADNGRTVDVPVGSTIEVRLAETMALYAWTVPQATATVLAPGQSQRHGNGDADASFTAHAAGQASVSAENNCTPSGCQGSSSVWRIDVAVR